MKKPAKFSRRDFLKGSVAAAALLGLNAVGLSPSASAETAEKAENPCRDLYILHTNDVHCAMDTNLGYAGLMEVKNALLAAGKDVLLADSGDYLQGAAAGTLSKGKYLIDIMNAAGYDVVTVGNHEFDYGMDIFFERMSELNFPVVCCNLLDEEGNVLLDPYVILEAAGRKVAFVGAVTPSTMTYTNPAYFKDADGNFLYDFCGDTTGERLATAMQTAIDAAKAEGADKVVVLSHIGVGTPELNSDELIPMLSGVDFFLDGHSHTVLPSQTVKDRDGKDVILTQTGTQLCYIGLAVIKADGTVSAQLLDDTGMKSLIAEIQADMDNDLKTVVGSTKYGLWIHDPEDMNTRLVRIQETNLGDFCADALRVICGADIGLVNSGSLRTDLLPGDITYGNLLDVFPYNNNICVRKVKGSELLDALELGVHLEPEDNGSFLQVSGMSYTFDSSIPSPVKLDSNLMFVSCEGQRRVSEVYVNSEPLEEDREYTVAASDFFLRDSGGGFTMFHGDFVLESGPIDVQTLISYLQENLGGVVGEEYENPLGAGRIIGV